MTRHVLATDVVIAALDRADAHHPDAAKAVRAMIGDEVSLLSLVNYAETLVRPAESESAMRAAVGAIEGLGIQLIPPTPAIARDAAKLRGLGISLAGGFAIATARAYGATLASFDRRVRRAVETAGLELEPRLR